MSTKTSVAVHMVFELPELGQREDPRQLRTTLKHVNRA